MRVLKNVKEVAQNANKGFTKAIDKVVNKAKKIEDLFNFRRSLNEVREEYRNTCDDLVGILLDMDAEKLPKEMVEYIGKLREEQDYIEKLIDEIKSDKYKRCPNCKEFMPNYNLYCYNCGYHFTFD